MSLNDFVVLFKSILESEDQDEDEYLSLFRSHFQVTLIPVLDFEFINLDKLLDKLKKPDDYEGIIFSSPRCVTGVERSIRDGGDMSVLKDWSLHRHFAVGEKTGERIKCLGFMVKGTEAGNASNLAEIMSKEQFSKPFLYPKGSLTKDTFKTQLEEKGIITDDVVIYKTKPHPALELTIRSIVPQINGKTIYFAYFSPSGVNFTIPILKNLQFDLNKIKFTAIGTTTAKAIAENGLKVSATASKPEPNALLEVIKTLMQ